MRAAEDARVTAPAEVAPILTGLRSTDPRLVVQAVRALGRFERPELVTHILPLATHGRSEVRAEALNALGQALARVPRAAPDASPLPPDVSTVTRTLVARMRTETDPYVIGIAAETLARVPYRSAEAVAEAERALIRPLAASHPATVSGAVKGLETLVRVYQKLHTLAAPTLAGLRAAATLGTDPSDADLAYIRRVAWAALNAAAAVDTAFVERGLDDPDAQVRRLAVVALGAVQHDEARLRGLLARALRDAAFIVRYDAVRVYSRTLQASDCGPVLAAVEDDHAHVALAAIDALGAGCPEGRRTLLELSDALSEAAGAWHKPAHAFVSLARTSREEATSRLARFAEHSVWQVRMYAARAAEALGAAARLERLAADAHDNVREAAITGLARLKQHDAGDLYISALVRPDYQLVLTAVRLFAGSPNADRVVPALVAAFARLTAERRDTSRDPRIAILERLRELGAKQHAPALQSCLADFDPAVAAACAATLNAWTGLTLVPKAARRPLVPVEAIAARRARITMARGGAFDVRLLPDEAPATVTRFVRLARQGYYTGLTFHRVVPNFVVQGGSPGANEYMGDGPYMRDELGLRTHARGTVGISTRGRDTGDAQIFVNLLDNPRLDHNYTVFGEVSSGMDVVDGILEGDVIERIDVLEPAAARSGR